MDEYTQQPDRRDGQPEIARVAAPAPTTGSDPLFVTVQSFDGGRSPHGPCLWTPPAGDLPQAGDVCVIVRSLEEDGESERAVVIAFDRDTAPVAPDNTALFLPGDLKATARASAPAGWLMCDGSIVVRVDYPALFDAIGTAYNSGGESGTQFRLPNLMGRVPVGRDTGQTEFDTLGESGGAKTHTLTTPEIPAHNHAPTPGTSFIAGGLATAAVVATGGGVANVGSVTNTANAGGGGAHNNLQPYQVVNYMIFAGA